MAVLAYFTLKSTKSFFRCNKSGRLLVKLYNQKEAVIIIHLCNKRKDRKKRAPDEKTPSLTPLLKCGRKRGDRKASTQYDTGAIPLPPLFPRPLRRQHTETHTQTLMYHLENLLYRPI